MGEGVIEMKNNLTILVVSYDGYKDMWNDFFNCKKLNWPDCPYETVLANNIDNFEYEGVKVINCGKNVQWSTRTRKALEAINTKYVCFMLEDFYISKKVDTTEIEDALKTMETNEIKYYKLLSLSKITTPYFNENKGERIIPANLRYGVSLMAAIWDREYFINVIGHEDYNPWKFEVDRNVETQMAQSTDPICGIYNERNILQICHMVVQGKYIPGAVRRMEHLGYKVNVGERGCQSFWFMFLYGLKQILYPIYIKSTILKKIVVLLGIETVSKKNS